MSDEILDLDELKERVQDDIELLLELLDIFSEDYKEKRKLLTESLENNDLEQLKSLAHSLKGASGNISAKQIRERFIELEEMGRAGDISGGGDVLTNLDSQYAELEKRFGSVKEELS